jgi:hypothetical protein
MSNQNIFGYVFNVEDNTGPQAIITPAEQESVIGAVVKMDGRASFDTAVNPSLTLTYHWSFSRVPIGSQVILEGFTSLDPDSSVVTFAPDIVGFYEVQLIVNDGSISSDPFIASVDVSIIVVPNNKDLIPDASFIWNYLSDFWSRVEERAKFEVFWSSAIQIVSAELLKQYQYDYNKSIKDIQRIFQKRWINYSSGVFFNRASITAILAEDQAGLESSTSLLDVISFSPLISQPDFSNLVTIPLSEGNFVTTSYNSPVSNNRIITIGERSYSMIRSNNSVKAINEGVDGETVLNTGNFKGSGFASYVGFKLKILSGVDKGTYLITSVTNSSNLVVNNLDNSLVLFLGSTSVSYTVIPNTNTISNFFADVNSVPTGMADQPWRFSSTLISTEFDLEALGVSIGDVLEVEITRLDLNLVSLVRFQVVGVDRSKLSFVFNLDDLTVGIPSRGLSKQTQIDLATNLRVTGLSTDATGNLQYALEASLIKQTVSSPSFKRKFFESIINTESEIDVGAFKFKARPIRVIRNSRIAIDSEIVSIPMLQEYIRQPDLAELDGVTQIIDRNGKMFPISRKPFVLSENLDYVIDDEAKIIGIASTVQNVDLINIVRGDLVDRSVQAGDTITLTTGSTKQIYHIRKVIDADTVRVFPVPINTANSIPFLINRRIAGKFLRFTNKTFTKVNSNPDRLWAELTYFNNDANIEANFGVLVGVSRDTINKRGVKTPYKSVVEGLMYSLVKGPIQENLRLSAQILLGLPFALNPGVITEINPNFRIRPDGSPLFGRILVEARDKNNTKIGITDVYLFPQGRQLPDPNNLGNWIPATPKESGIAINPNSGIEYKVGDAVTKFSILSKGVEVSDYLSDKTLTQRFIDQGTLEALITQYHSFKLRINSDITTPSDIDITTEFIKTAKPHYVKISAGLLKIIEDFIAIEDALTFKLFYSFFDNVSSSLPTATKFDNGLGETGFISVEGTMYSKYVFGTDLDTTFSSSDVFSTTGGFVTAVGNHFFDTPFIKSGDLLIINSGPNKGSYNISVVQNDHTLTLSGSPSFQTKLNQPFGIFRPIKNPIFEGTVTVTNGSQDILFSSGTFSAGVAVGDILTFTDGISPSHMYTIASLTTTSTKIMESSGTYNASVWRESLVTKYFGNTSSATPFSASFSTGAPAIVFDPLSSDLTKLLFLKYGDQIIRGSDTFTVVDFDSSMLVAYVYPSPTFTAISQLSISRPYKAITPISVDFLERIPEEVLSLKLQLPSGGQDLTTTNGSTFVSTVSGRNFSTLGVFAGDFLVIFSGGDSTRDIGYGAGVFPILKLSSTTILQLTRPLLATNGSPGVRYGIQRKKPV